jgi:hypothetical protein
VPYTSRDGFRYTVAVGKPSLVVQIPGLSDAIAPPGQGFLAVPVHLVNLQTDRPASVPLADPGLGPAPLDLGAPAGDAPSIGETCALQDGPDGMTFDTLEPVPTFTNPDAVSGKCLVRLSVLYPPMLDPGAALDFIAYSNTVSSSTPIDALKAFAVVENGLAETWLPIPSP